MFDVQSLKDPAVIVAIGWLAFGKVILGVLFGKALDQAPMRAHRVFTVPVLEGQAARERTTSWHVVSDAVAMVLLIGTELIRLTPTTAGSVLVTFVIFYVWVETYYYFGHPLMHSSRFLYRFHRVHHLSKVVTPLSSISMSLVEKSFLYTGGWLAFMAAVSWVCPISLGGLVAYYTYHFVLHGHSNTEASAHGLGSANEKFDRSAVRSGRLGIDRIATK